MAYEYDVFISYRQTSIGNYWVTNYFKPCLEDELREVLGKEPKIFHDNTEIRSGDSLPHKIKNALAKSRCLVALLSGTYFTSEYCSLEFAVMENRESRYGIPDLDKTKRLIIPIIVRDGEHLPSKINSIAHKREWSKYYTSCESFRACTDYRNFEAEVINLAEDIHQATLKAPLYTPDWLSNEWLDISVDHLYKKEITIDNNPILK
jgi:hypothetical protein